MKKAILLVQLAVVAGITHVAAQQRVYDLETIIVSPANNATIKLDESFETEFYFKNLGPDPVLANDTLVIQFNDGTSNAQGYLVGKILNAGDTVGFKFSVTASSTPTPSNPFDYCINGIIYSTFNDLDYDITNNRECISLNFKEESTGIAELLSEKTPASAVNIYPNPADDMIRLNYKVKEQGNVAMTITDMSGRTVVHTGLGCKNVGDTEISTDVSGLAPGMYFVEITESHAKGRGRLLIQR